MRSHGFRIAGVAFRLSFSPEANLEPLVEAWRPFEFDGAVAFAVQVALRPGPPPARKITRELPELSSAGEISHPDFHAHLFPGHPDRPLPADSTQVEQWAADRFPIESVVKLLLARELLRKGGVLIHGVSVAGRRASLFTGRSGAGKSTLGARSAEAGLSVLADELVAVLPDASAGSRAFGTPWNVGVPRDAPLAFVGALAWGEPRLEELPKAEILRLLLSNTVMPLPGEAGRARLFLALGRLVDATPCRRFTFPNDARAGATLAMELA